jgi:hypothetical protein
MNTLLKQFILNWLKAPFKGNPIVEQPAEYMPKVAEAVKVGFKGATILIGVGMLAVLMIIISVLFGWL